MSEPLIHPRAAMTAAGALRGSVYRGLGVRPQAAVRDATGTPLGLSRSVPFGAQMRSELVTRDDRKFYRVEGYATVFDKGYPMWDMFGEYTEYVDAGAADETLAANPDVVFLVNHKGLAMARTKGKTLELEADSTGLLDVGWLNPERTDVKDLILSIDDGIVTEQSFAFMITEGWWNQDFTEFRIKAFDIDRGDVSAVNYGANPHTSIAARQRDIFAELDLMPPAVARAVIDRLSAREDIDLIPRQSKPINPVDLDVLARHLPEIKSTGDAARYIAQRYGTVANAVHAIGADTPATETETAAAEVNDGLTARGRSFAQAQLWLQQEDNK